MRISIIVNASIYPGQSSCSGPIEKRVTVTRLVADLGKANAQLRMDQGEERNNEDHVVKNMWHESTCTFSNKTLESKYSNCGFDRKYILEKTHIHPAILPRYPSSANRGKSDITLYDSRYIYNDYAAI